jgi:aminomethyltransferase
MKQTPLHEWHVAHGATMTDFNGWSMPLYYSGMTDEHLHTRRAAGLFDLCHMGRVMLRGAGAHRYVDELTPARLREAKQGDVLYSFLLTEQGRTIDDITVYLLPDRLMLVVNAGNRERAVAWIRAHAEGMGDVSVEDLSEEWAMLALQGPDSDAVMREAFGAGFNPLPYYTVAELRMEAAGGTVLVSATGYTGERGYEVYLPSSRAGAAWEAVMAAGARHGVKPVGLGARDSLRLEAAMPLYGHELTDETTPLDAGLGKFLDLDKPAFVGRDALLTQKAAGGPPRKLACMEMRQRGPVPRQGCTLHLPGGDAVGTVTSGILAPSLQKNIAMGYVDAAFAIPGTDAEFEIRGRRHPAVLVKRPFYRRSA